MKSIGLNHSVEREVVSFQGCGAGINGLRLASQYAVTHPGRLALLVSVELPSLHMHKVKGGRGKRRGGVQWANAHHQNRHVLVLGGHVVSRCALLVVNDHCFLPFFLGFSIVSLYISSFSRRLT